MKTIVDAFNMCFGMFSIIPVKKNVWNDEAVKYLLFFLPIVGLIHGLLAYWFLKLLIFFNVSTILATSFFMVFYYLQTGFIHLDGFMDTCDAFFSRKDIIQRKKILKDSHVGAFAVIFLVFMCIMSFSSFYCIILNGKNLKLICLIPIASRCLSVFFTYYSKPLEESSYAKSFGEQKSNFTTVIPIIFFILTNIFGYYFCGLKSIIVMFFLSISYSFFIIRLLKSFGGISGDFCGYAITLSELIGFICLALLK